MSAFLELADCPGCGGEVHVRFDGEAVCLACATCEREYGKGSPRATARTLCVYWNIFFGEPDA